jgi:8-hydroxy-5-deazaflavin:NADPH oxidoreductase
MAIAVIGAGNVGQALGEAWRGKGESVVYGVRNPSDKKYASLGAATVKGSADAARAADVIVLATPWHATEATCKSLDVNGKIVIDCTNPLAMSADGLSLVLGFTTSGGEMVAQWCLGASVFKAFNQTGFENMKRAERFSPKAVMFVAGDDQTKKSMVLKLVETIGFEAFDAGSLKNARLLEPLAMLWIDMVMKGRMDRDRAFALTRASN